MVMNGNAVLNIDIAADTGTIALTTWTLYTISNGIPDIRWSMNPSVPGATITIVVEDVSGETTFSIYRDGVEVNRSTSDINGILTFTVIGGWSPHEMIIAVPGLFPPGQGGELPTMPPLTSTSENLDPRYAGQFVARCSLGPFDWLSASTSADSKTVTINDGRPIARNVILYVVSWGDGNTSQAVQTPISHTYQLEGIYNITIRVQYANNVIEMYVAPIDVRGNNCSLVQFTSNIFPILMGVGALSIVSAIIVAGARYRKYSIRARLLRVLLIVGIVSLGSVIAIAIYASIPRMS